MFARIFEPGKVARPALDLTKSVWSHRHGDVTVYGSWWLADDNGPRPCLVILPTLAQHYERCRPCVVTVDDAWVWSEEIGDPVRAARQAIEFVRALRLPEHRLSAFRVASIIRDHLGDLLAIPPRPRELTEVVASGILTDEHGRERYGELREHV